MPYLATNSSFILTYFLNYPRRLHLMNNSIKQFKRKKQKIKYGRIGFFLALLDWTVFVYIWLRINRIETSVRFYLTDSTSPVNGFLNPFYLPFYLFLAIFFFQSQIYPDTKNRHWTSFNYYFIPVAAGSIIALFYKNLLFSYIKEITHEFQSVAIIDYYSLFAILLIYASIRVLFCFDYYIAYLNTTNKRKLFWVSIYGVAFLVVLFITTYLPTLYPYE